MSKTEKTEEEKFSAEQEEKPIEKNNETEKIKPIENETPEGKIKPIEEETPEEKLVNLQNKLLRTMAEMENQRRRFEKEIKEAYEFGGFNFAAESLAIIDNIDRAIVSFKNDESLKNNKDLNKIIGSIEIVKSDLISTFKKKGIESIECLNKKFDPNFHQAMLEVEDDANESGIVVQEIQKGYMMKNRLLRPSFVGVSKKKTENKEKK